MRTIYVNNLTKLNIEDRTELVDREQVKDGAKISVSLQDISCSCNTKLLSSIYLDEDVSEHHYGFPTSALDRSLEAAFAVMKDGETAKISVHLSKKLVSEEVLTDVILSCTARLTIIKNGLDVYEYNMAQKLEFSCKCKEAGCMILRQHSDSYPAQLSAFFLLERAVKWLAMIDATDLAADSKAEVLAIRCQCYNNLSYLHLTFNHPELAVAAAKFVIGEEENNIKALYRRAVANTQLQNYELARDDLNRALEVEPKNKTLHKQLQIIAQKQKIVDDKYAIAMKKFLNL